jgi:hypothetical protein
METMPAWQSMLKTAVWAGSIVNVSAIVRSFRHSALQEALRYQRSNPG